MPCGVPTKITAFSNTCIRKIAHLWPPMQMWRLIYNKTCNGLLNVLLQMKILTISLRLKAEIWSACFSFFLNRMASHYFLLLWLFYFYWWMTFTLDPKSHANHKPKKVWNLFIIKYYYSNFWIMKELVFFN